MTIKVNNIVIEVDEPSEVFAAVLAKTGSYVEAMAAQDAVYARDYEVL